MAALRDLCPDVDRIAGEMVGPVRDVVTAAADDASRPLYRANRAVSPPDDPVAELWQHCTTMREHRGDGHVTALRRARLDGCEAHVLFAADADIPAERLRESRGWTEEEWDAAAARLRERSLVDEPGRATDAGRDVRRLVERATDAAARVLFAGAPAGTLDRLVEGLDPLAAEIAASGVIPYPNPIGVPRPG
jgi:hypothetical protein